MKTKNLLKKIATIGALCGLVVSACAVNWTNYPAALPSPGDTFIFGVLTTNQFGVVTNAQITFQLLASNVLVQAGGLKTNSPVAGANVTGLGSLAFSNSITLSNVSNAGALAGSNRLAYALLDGPPTIPTQFASSAITNSPWLTASSNLNATKLTGTVPSGNLPALNYVPLTNGTAVNPTLVNPTFQNVTNFFTEQTNLLAMAASLGTGWFTNGSIYYSTNTTGFNAISFNNLTLIDGAKYQATFIMVTNTSGGPSLYLDTSGATQMTVNQSSGLGKYGDYTFRWSTNQANSFILRCNSGFVGALTNLKLVRIQ